MDQKQYVQWFRNTSPYINAHRGKTLVLLLNGESLADDNLPNIIHDIATLSSLGARLCIVFGARPQIDQKLADHNIDSVIEQRLRVTSEHALPYVKDAVGSLRIQLESMLSMGLPNSPMHGADIRISSGNYITAQPIGVKDGVDFGNTGEVRRVDHQAILDDLGQGRIVIIPPLGFSPMGEVFNLPSEALATDVAKAIQADKLVLFQDSPGVMQNGKLVRELTPGKIRQLLKTNPLDPLIEVNLRSSLVALNYLSRVHLVSYQSDGALLQELYTLDGCGTLLTREPTEVLRQASIADTAGILDLIQPLEQKGVLVKRSRELLEQEIEQFTVMDWEGMIVGCSALYPYHDPDTNITWAELACVVVHPEYRGDARGEKLLAYIEQKCRARNFKKLFVLTTRTGHWFIEQGFQKAEPEQLPPARQQLYNWQRNSRILVKDI
ncbi:amino-acid N-acetyltransferase [Litoribacillus peritrichatus]|uniref:Amino-acid acetyltransferase n=1 Tax=Litoribacillus peritrichatus TaxID=718191 RepID=A0ABP7NEP5_9GAMM